MASKISTDSARALAANRPFKRDNTEVDKGLNGAGKPCWYLDLHGNTIAIDHPAKRVLTITTTGWDTVTTKARLNAVLDWFGLPWRVSHDRKVLYLYKFGGGERYRRPWDGRKIDIDYDTHTITGTDLSNVAENAWEAV